MAIAPAVTVFFQLVQLSVFDMLQRDGYVNHVPPGFDAAVPVSEAREGYLTNFRDVVQLIREEIAPLVPLIDLDFVQSLRRGLHAMAIHISHADPQTGRLPRMTQGRTFFLLVFTGLLAERAIDEGNANLVPSIIQWIAEELTTMPRDYGDEFANLDVLMEAAVSHFAPLHRAQEIAHRVFGFLTRIAFSIARFLVGR